MRPIFGRTDIFWPKALHFHPIWPLGHRFSMAFELTLKSYWNLSFCIFFQDFWKTYKLKNMAIGWPRANFNTWHAFAPRAKHIFGQKKHSTHYFGPWPRTYFMQAILVRFWTKFLSFGKFSTCLWILIWPNFGQYPIFMAKDGQKGKQTSCFGQEECFQCCRQFFGQHRSHW